MGPYQVLPLWVTMYLGVVAMKEYSTFPKAPGLGPHHQMQFNFIPKTLTERGVVSPCRGAVGVLFGPR